MQIIESDGSGITTLAELRSVLTDAETELTGGLTPRLSPLPGLRDMAGLLQRAGLALPVADRDTVTVRYTEPLRLLSDLKGMGERAAFARGHARPLPRRVLFRALELYIERYGAADGRVPATFEIVHVLGWARVAWPTIRMIIRPPQTLPVMNPSQVAFWSRMSISPR